MLSCKEVVTGASDFKDKNLSWREALGYRLHILMCHHCRKFFRQFVNAIGVASTIAAQPASDSQLESVLAATIEEQKT